MCFLRVNYIVTLYLLDCSLLFWLTFVFLVGYRDLQSYLSDLSIFLGNKSKKIYILVDNRPWLNPGTRSAHFWQLMVTKVVKAASSTFLCGV